MDQTATVSILFKVKNLWAPAKREKGKAVHTTLQYTPSCYLLYHLTWSQTQVLFKHRYASNDIPQSSHVEAVSGLSPGPANGLNAIFASYDTMTTVRTLTTQCTTGSEKALAKPDFSF